MERLGVLATPVIAVNDAATKTLFDNRYGTAQSCVFAIADILDDAGVTVRDQPALVIGYGPVGQGVAAYLRALGAEVSVAERDAVRALQAAHDGFPVGAAADLARGALVVSATGAASTITSAIRDVAAAVAVAGGVPGELELDDALDRLTPLGAHLDVLAPTGTLVLDKGGCINVTAAEGNPIEIMDLSFATQIAAMWHVASARPAQGVHALPESVTDRVARVAAAARGLTIESAAPEHRDPQRAWRSRRFVKENDA
jgi:adenosylhomocysteinase